MARRTDEAFADEVYPEHGPMGFDVVVQAVIGHVDVQPFGEGESPHVAAFRLIAGHDTPGSYSFPMADGRVCRVEVEYAEVTG